MFKNLINVTQIYKNLQTLTYRISIKQKKIFCNHFFLKNDKNKSKSDNYFFYEYSVF